MYYHTWLEKKSCFQWKRKKKRENWSPSKNLVGVIKQKLDEAGNWGGGRRNKDLVVRCVTWGLRPQKQGRSVLHRQHRRQQSFTVENCRPSWGSTFKVSISLGVWRSIITVGPGPGWIVCFVCAPVTKYPRLHSLLIVEIYFWQVSDQTGNRISTR